MLYLRFFTIIINLLFFRKMYIKFYTEKNCDDNISSRLFTGEQSSKKNIFLYNNKQNKNNIILASNIKPKYSILDGCDLRYNTEKNCNVTGSLSLFSGEQSSKENIKNISKQTGDKKYSIARNFYKKNLLSNLKDYNISLKEKINMIRNNYIELYNIKDLNNEL